VSLITRQIICLSCRCPPLDKNAVQFERRMFKQVLGISDRQLLDHWTQYEFLFSGQFGIVKTVSRGLYHSKHISNVVRDPV
jgi:hypothetical protein